jgi:hypothetical protein
MHVSNLLEEDASAEVHYNITCKPKVWLLLSSLYRSLKFVRPTMLDMLRRSAGDCWFVTLLVSSDKGTQREMLEDDFQFFERRRGFLSVTRHGDQSLDRLQGVCRFSAMIPLSLTSMSSQRGHTDKHKHNQTYEFN